MQIIPYKQTFSHSCLAAALLMLTGKKHRSKLEREFFIKGTSGVYPYYVVGVPFELSKALALNLTVYVDNKFFTGVLKTAFKKSKRISVIHQKIEADLIEHLVSESPIVCHIDDHYLGDYSHASHFVVIEKVNKNRITIIDPFYGKRRIVNEKTLIESIKSLKTHIKMCPLIFQFSS